ncbi:hypothetical protein F4813DRAFT_374343 [Daldinia decipiens]|uniref:uncharacterized protein n=1 Tax=Daldinia decipiens TaxID=326647 RepID=UPI0020C4A740|nr:uncharacterized protein F4813DRAFT_374343 [Daldinia decipiens]KAI1653449.1 hypothetical protein F4813DRAFT_374343 [Daldinia decipiens]
MISGLSILLRLGFAGTVKMRVDHGGYTKSDDLLRGYRGAVYLGIGLAGLGLAISLVFAIKQAWNNTEKEEKIGKLAAAR